MALKRYSLWLQVETIRALKKLAKDQDRPVGYLIRKAMERFVAEKANKARGK